MEAIFLGGDGLARSPADSCSAGGSSGSGLRGEGASMKFVVVLVMPCRMSKT